MVLWLARIIGLCASHGVSVLGATNFSSQFKTNRIIAAGFGTSPACMEEVDLRNIVVLIRYRAILKNSRQKHGSLKSISEKDDGRSCRKKGNRVPACLEGEDYRPLLLVFWDSEAMQNTGLHVPNLVVGMTVEDATPCLFADETCIDHFLDWLEQLTEQDTRYVTLVAHKFKGYDSYFIVPRLIARKQKFEQICTGVKLLELTFRNGYIRFIDSLSFLTTPLVSFTSMFDLDPDDYVGDQAPKDMYCPNTMSTKGKAKFERWYEEQVANGVQFDIHTYIHFVSTRIIRVALLS